MPVKAAGILLYRFRRGIPEFLLIHPGGPYYVRKDEGIWSVPKGIIAAGEEELSAAIREFEEETGMQPSPPFLLLPMVKYGSGKLLTVYASEGDFDCDKLKSNFFELEWPPGSGQIKQFPEADRAGWFTEDEAVKKLLKAQQALPAQLISALKKG